MKSRINRMAETFFFFFLAVSALLAAAGCAGRVRVYDTEHSDYHRWNAGEDRAYRRYWMETHARDPYREYGKLNENEQRDYWNWRHSHPDQDRH